MEVVARWSIVSFSHTEGTDEVPSHMNAVYCVKMPSTEFCGNAVVAALADIRCRYSVYSHAFCCGMTNIGCQLNKLTTVGSFVTSQLVFPREGLCRHSADTTSADGNCMLLVRYKLVTARHQPLAHALEVPIWNRYKQTHQHPFSLNSFALVCTSLTPTYLSATDPGYL